jgi:hypothetical protein
MTQKAEIIQKVASIFHEEWRKNRLQDDWTYKPMIEKSEDETRTKEHWTQAVDLANTDFEDLPNNWKHENIEAAKVAVDLVYEKILNLEKIATETIEKMSKIVHEKRLERNWIAWSFENQRVSYEDLSEEEKEKDRLQIKTAIEVINLYTKKQ